MRRYSSRLALAPSLTLAALGLLALVSSGAAQAMSGAGARAYIGLFKDNAVAVVDASSNSILATIPVAPGPHGIVASSDGTRVFVSSDDSSVVNVIDTGKNSVIATIEVGKAPHGLALTPDGRTLLVADFGTDAVVFVDTRNLKILGRTPSPSPHNIAISSDGLTAYVADQAKGKTAIQLIDLRSMKEKASIPLDKAPRALNLSPDGSRLYFTLAGLDELQVYDAKTLKSIKSIPVGASPHHPLVTKDGKLALVVSQGTGELSIIDAAKGEVLARVKVGTMPHWIALDPDGKRAYVTNEGSGDLSVVSLESQALISTMAVGNAPRKIVIVGGSGAAAGATGSISTRIAGFAFADELRAVVGQSVVWTNADSVPHTVTSDSGLFDSGDIASGQSFAMSFDKPGSYSYFCKNHPMMRGTVKVVAE